MSFGLWKWIDLLCNERWVQEVLVKIWKHAEFRSSNQESSWSTYRATYHTKCTGRLSLNIIFRWSDFDGIHQVQHKYQDRYWSPYFHLTKLLFSYLNLYECNVLCILKNHEGLRILGANSHIFKRFAISTFNLWVKSLSWSSKGISRGRLEDSRFGNHASVYVMYVNSASNSFDVSWGCTE